MRLHLVPTAVQLLTETHLYLQGIISKHRLFFYTCFVSEIISHIMKKVCARCTLKKGELIQRSLYKLSTLTKDKIWLGSYLLVFLHLQIGSVEIFDSSYQWSRMISHQNFYPSTPGNKEAYESLFKLKQLLYYKSFSYIKQLQQRWEKGMWSSFCMILTQRSSLKIKTELTTQPNFPGQQSMMYSNNPHQACLSI